MIEMQPEIVAKQSTKWMRVFYKSAKWAWTQKITKRI